MPTTLSGGATRRQARSVHNDLRILDAALDLTDRAGWKGLNVTQVAEVSGLSRPTVRARFTERPAIAVGLWSMRVVAPLTEALEQVVKACSQHEPLDATTLSAALGPFIHPSRELRAAAELLIVGRYEPTLGAAIATTLVPEIERWLDPRWASDRGVGAARRAFGLILALGLLIEVRRHPAVDVDFSIEMANLATAFSSPVAPAVLPDTTAPHLDRVANFETGDDALDELLHATLEHVAREGYEAATIEHIAASTQRTEGFIFSRYPNKRELFLDANRRYSEVASSLNEAFLRAVAEASSAGLAEAATTRELMRPERRTIMTVSLELYRLSWHDPDVLDAIDAGYEDVIRQHAAQVPEMSSGHHRAWMLLELARGNGPLLLGGLSDIAWNLPYDTVTVPLVDGVS
jgi:AcrR family transcriptional regulator